jgi:CBS domain containing-hemolysin-like protein
MVNRMLDLQNFTVGQIAKRRWRKRWRWRRRRPLRDAIQPGARKKLSRLPVWETRDGNSARRRIARCVGPLLFREDLDLRSPPSAYMIPALFVNENMRLEVALRLMQRAGQRLAIVLARDGAEIGIVRLEDILKVMFGEMKL